MRSRATNFGFWTSATLSRTILDFRLSDDNQNLKSEISQGNPNNNCITAKVLGVPSIAYGVS
ncbi:MAG: hypothetical protein V7K65_03115 [Nostoc sp.]